MHQFIESVTDSKFLLTEEEKKQYTSFKCPNSDNLCPGKFTEADIKDLLAEDLYLEKL